MQSKNEYLDTVCSQIRFGAARKTLRLELETHIDDKMDELLQHGEKDAKQKAVAAMGDAVQTGKALDAVHRPRKEWGVILCMLLLSALSAVISVTMTQYGNNILVNSLYSEMIVPMIRGFVLLVAMYFINYALLKHLRYALYSVGLLYILVYILTYDPHSWGSFGGLLNQTPVIVIATFLFLLSMISFIAHDWKKRILKLTVLSILSIVSIVVLYMVSSVNALLLTMVYIAVFIVSRWKKRAQPWLDIAIYTTILAICFVICAFLVQRGQYAFRATLFTDLNQEEVSNVLQRASFVGPATTRVGVVSSRINFVITAIIGAYGWLAGIGVAIISCAMCVFMLRRSLHIAHSYGRLLATGISVYFIARFVMFFLANMGLIDGYFSLPFISFGRFEYLADALLVGIFLSIWRTSTFMKDENEAGAKISLAGSIE